MAMILMREQEELGTPLEGFELHERQRKTKIIFTTDLLLFVVFNYINYAIKEFLKERHWNFSAI